MHAWMLAIDFAWDAGTDTLADYLKGDSWTLMAEHAEVESGKNDARPALAKALCDCRLMGATLVIAKLDACRATPTSC